MLFHRSEHTKIPLEPFGVVILNEILNHRYKAASVSEAYPVIPLSLQDTPEAFHWAIINAFSNSGHALGHAGFGQHAVECTVCVLKASVAVAQRMRVRIRRNRCSEGIKHQRIVIGIPNHVADDPSVIQIQDGTEIYLLYFNTDVVFEFGNIGQPFLVGLVCLEFPVQQIVCQVIWIFALPSATMVAVLNRGLNPAAPADPQHPFVIHMSVVVPIQFILKPAVAHLWMLFMNILN